MFNERQFKIWVTAMAVIFVVVGVTWYSSYMYERFDGKRMYQRVKNNRKVYVNDTYNGAINSVMYVSNNNDTSALIEFYRDLEKGGGGVIKFPIKTLPYNVPVYLVYDTALTRSSNIVEVVYIDSLSKTWEYERGLVYKGVVHINPPNDSLLNRKDKFY